ncbi:LysR family transcriptional regulator [Streptomyces sp. NPDC090106]|uniref:LysR family transcriptional regulator n=1 Tax=Streptomyces sp. NPDC090106 TaxID=3365946 RepID=UPI00382F0133
MYDVHRLRLLLELKRRGTLTAVAEALNYSPSTISQQLSQLESEVGVPLLVPAGRRVRLTPQADVLAAHAEIVLRQLEAAEAALAQSLTELTGTVRIASFQTGLLGLLSPVLTTLDARHPGVRVEVFQVEPQIALPGMLAHEYDLVIAEEFRHQPLPRQSDIDYRELFQDPLRLALPVADADASTTAGDGGVWEVVAQRPWVAEALGSASRNWLRTLCREAGFEPDIRFTTDDLLVQRQLVADGHAVAILPDLLDAAQNPKVALVTVPGGPHTRRILTASRRDASAHPAIEACRAAFAATARA